MSPLQFGPPVDDSVELARAELYGLLSALFQAPPSGALYEQLRGAVTQAPVAGAFLEHAFGALVQASRRVPLTAVAEEYDTLFQGIGRPEVFLHASYFIAGALNARPLVALRDDLVGLGIERDPAQFVTEDHLAFMCEVMRLLIAGEDREAVDLATQRRFFDTHLRGWADALWDALEMHPRSDFYRSVARLGRDFFSVEAQAFDMLEP